LANLQVYDAAGQPLLAVESVRINRSPLSLAANSRDLGTIEAVRPTVYLSIRPDGSNWEDALEEILTDLGEEVAAAEELPADQAATAVSFRVVEGTVLAEDAAGGRRWRVQVADLQYDAPTGTGDLGRIVASGQISSVLQGVAAPPGSFVVSMQALDDGRQQLKWQLDAVPMALADPLLRRYVTGVEAGGVLSGDGSATWTANPSGPPLDLETTGTLRVEQFDATAPALRGDRLRLLRVELPWRLSARPDGLAIDTLELRCDVGNVAIRGHLDAGTRTSASWLQPTARHDVEMRGSVDLARLATMLPNALRIRQGTTITSGTIDVAARCRPVDGGQLLTGSVRTAQLAATNAGRPLRWDEPANATFAVRRQPGAVQLDTLQFNSDFLRIDTSGTPQQVAARAQFDLARLTSQLGQLVELSGTELAGEGELTARVRSEGSVVEVTDATLHVSKFRAVAGGWTIDEPRVELTGNVRWNGVTRQLVSDSAQLITSTASLATKDARFQMGDDGIRQMNGLAAFRVDLARLAAWNRSAAQTPTWQPQGMFTGNVRLDQQADRVSCEIQSQGQNVALAEWRPRAGNQPAGYQTIWQEPQLTLRGRATYLPAVDRLAFDELQVQSNTLQATVGGRIEQLTTTADANFAGTLNYDLVQLTPLLRPYVGDAIQLVGREQARFAVEGRLGQGATDSAIRNSRSAIHWSRRLQARVEAPWSSANLYGLPVGPGKIAAALGDGAVRVEPLALALAEGRLTASPFVRLDPAPAELSLPSGPLLTDVRITPEVSEAMLKYVAPVLAGVTRSEGQFSIQMEGLRLPLDAPSRCDAGGQLTVHAARVAPGPLAETWIELAQQIEAITKGRDPAALVQRQPVTLLTIADQSVNFRVVDGRVYHQDMQFQVGDVVLHSQGSVGLDESIALVLTVPIQDRWIEREKLLVGLKGQSLSIPVSGTLRRPQLDRKAVADLSRQLLQGAAQQTIGNEVNKALDKLFKQQ
jgi:hypothetical protein